MNIRKLSAVDQECVSILCVVVGLGAMIGSVALGRTDYALLCIASGTLLAFMGVILVPSPAAVRKERFTR